MALSENPIGKTLGQYKIAKELGRGGMGIVYKAHDEALGRFVALKVLPPHLAKDQAFLKRFQNEARAVAQLSHPNVVTLFNIGSENDVHYLAMEFIRGQDLAEIIDKKGRMKPKRALEIAADLADALGAAHSRNIIHRDIKPQNIMIDTEGAVKLMDFGIAKLVGGGTTRLTQPGNVMGTPAYMSPEHCRGEDLDARTDVYSLGVVLYQMLTGQVPFDADTPIAVLRKILDDPVPPVSQFLPDVPRAVVRIVNKTLSKNASRRYATGTELAADIRRVLGNGTMDKAGASSAKSAPPKTSAVPAAKKPSPPPPAAKPAAAAERPAPPERKTSAAPAAQKAAPSAAPQAAAPARPAPPPSPPARAPQSPGRAPQAASPARSEPAPRSAARRPAPRAARPQTSPASPGGFLRTLILASLFGATAFASVRATRSLLDDPDFSASLGLDRLTKINAGAIREAIRPTRPAEPLPVTETADPVNPTILVGGPDGLPTLIEAVEAAEAGAKILVRPGRYAGPVTLTREVTIEGDGVRDEIILVSDNSNCLEMRTERAAVRGITILCTAPADQHKVAVSIPQGTLIIEDCDISSSSFANIFASGPDANPEIRRSRIHHSNSSGIIFANKARGLVENCEIFANAISGIDISEEADPLIRNTRIHGQIKGGINVFDNGLGRVENCDISDNVLIGVQIKTGGNPVIRGSRINNNQATGVKVFDEGRGTIAECSFRGNGGFGALHIKVADDQVRLEKNKISKGN